VSWGLWHSPYYGENYPAPKNQLITNMSNGESCSQSCKSSADTSPENLNLALVYNSSEEKWQGEKSPNTFYAGVLFEKPNYGENTLFFAKYLLEIKFFTYFVQNLLS
jgi:hypothetical protein